MNESKVVVGTGEALWDILPEGKKIGGAPANFAYHVSQFGLQSYVVSAVGEDALGEEIRNTFQEKRLHSLLATVPYPIGIVNVEVDEVGVPQYIIKENVAWDNIPFTPELEALANGTCAVCFGSLAQRNVVSRDTVHRFIDAMPERDDRLIIFDVNLRQGFYNMDILDHSMQRCNVLKINDQELVEVCRMLDYPDIDFQSQCRSLLERYRLKVLILTCGIKGSYIFTSDDVSLLPTPQVAVADTVGASDSFTATFTASILKGLSVAEAHRRAVAASAYVCTQHGAMPLLPKEYTTI